MAHRKRPPLTKTRQQWAASRGGASFKGKPLNYPSVIEAKYGERLKRMVEQMTAATEKEIARLYRAPGAPVGHATDASFTSVAARLFRELGKRFNGLFTSQAGGLADYLAKGVQVSSAKQLGDSLKHVSGGVTLKTDVVSGAVAEVTKAAIKQNVALIKSIPAKYFDQIEGEVMRSIQTGRGMADLQPAIQKIGGVTKDRAALIARDQTAKATTAINKARMNGLGIKKFEWLHSAGEKHPRELHITPFPAGLNHGVFEINNPPVIDERTGERGLPGALINCRCRMVPVISFEAEEITP